MQKVLPDDEETGFIYVLKSKTTNPVITAIPNLYKIGFSTTPVEERIKNAPQDPTYLMADVQIIYTYKCFNINPQKFENFIIISLAKYVYQ
ncbi:MAG: GIY-YIG nuclease family protein [Bacteroidetes bacterium]|nr:GIY-YIG nuclease family protein [Bacteroidota bacterium]